MVTSRRVSERDLVGDFLAGFALAVMLYTFVFVVSVAWHDGAKL